MKKSKSLFQVAAEKYTNISSELKTNKKAFLEATVADLNKLYTKSKVGSIKDGVPTPNFSSMEKVNIGGSEGSNKTESPSGGVADAPVNPAASPVGKPGSADPTELAKGLQLVNINGVNYIIADNPEDYKFGKASDFKEYQAATDKFTKSLGEAATTYTVEDIMSALSVLGGGSNSEVLNTAPGMDMLGDDLATNVGPVGDTLVKEDDGDGGLSVGAEDEAAKETVDEDEGDDNTDDANQITEAPLEAGSTSGTTGVSSELMSPTDGDSTKTSPSTGSPDSASSFTTEKQDGLTGVDDSYVTETGEENEEKAPEGNIGIKKASTKGAGEAPEENSGALGPVADQQDGGEGESVWSAGAGSGKPMAKGAGVSAEDGTGQVGEQQPQIGEAGPNGEADPSGKESAFWLPNDDLLGLKDIVGAINHDVSGVNAQQTIGKDATGNLVKKPTMPAHSIPNMRQFVKTNGVPGAPSVLGMGQGGAPVDVSDLDGVMGMDTANDRALNISMNFNF